MWTTLRAGCLTVCVVFALTACTPVAGPAQLDPPFPAPGAANTTAHVYPLESGWFDGQRVQYYNFGLNTPLDPEDATRVASRPVWAFVIGVNPDGSPNKLPGQDSLFDTRIGETDYTDLWQAHFVTPAAGYVPNSLKSADALKASGMLIEKKPVLVNCPFVADGSALADNALPLTKGWVDDKPVVYFDFGATSAHPGIVYAFVTGFDAQGKPQLVPGQHFVFDATRTAANYSDFWFVYWVTVDAGYAPDSIRSAAAVDQARVTPSDVVVNYPHK